MNTTSIRALLEKPSRSNGSPLAAVSTHVDRDNEYEPFANGRIGNQPQLTLVFRKKDGSIRGFSYSYFYSITSDNPSDQLVIDFTHTTVKIQGRNLERLTQLISQHKVAEIVEASDRQILGVSETEPVVDLVSFQTK